MPPRLSIQNALLIGRQPLICLPCQLRALSTTRLFWFPEDKPKLPHAPPPNAPLGSTSEAHPLQDAPRSYGVKVEEFTPKPLLRPIGMNIPPTEGQNTGVDTRTFMQKKQDYADYQKHMERRKHLTQEFARPYFRDWINLKHYAGKAWIAPPRPFRQDLSLFFPNMYGSTLLKTDKAHRDTTPLLKDKASVVAVYSSMWGERQVDSFVSDKANAELQQIVGKSQGQAQIVRINIEEERLKALLINLFKGSLRHKMGESNWDKYFVVRHGITKDIRESIGLLNGKVGYTYLVDNECRIRWAGSADAHAEEKESLNKSLQRLLKEMGTIPIPPTTSTKVKATKK
ncbi:hypothetical protein MKZ38_004826 [Zalerion maritima]|uniref:Mitochondrial ATPase complex subunit ATP10 n=1 Tax=Zalerion maritima TaxID=339359 RepID=A0AAD5RL36_9PEZI|nr:hypothetical protein MKZ38_004826 [Zalerion maritima]